MRQFMGQSEPTCLTNANADSEWTTAAFLDYFSFPFTEWYTHESYYFVLILTTMTIKNVASLWWLDVENRHHIKSCGELPSMFRKTVRAANLHHTSSLLIPFIIRFYQLILRLSQHSPSMAV